VLRKNGYIMYIEGGDLIAIQEATALTTSRTSARTVASTFAAIRLATRSRTAT
jgi:hypothetical protein